MQKININGEIRFDASLKDITTLKTGGKADAIITPSGLSDLLKLIPVLREAEIPYIPLGAGSNVLASDEGFRGCIIDMGKFTRISIRGLYLCAGAGIRLEQIIRQVTAKSLAGIEHLSGIPGTFGGAIKCNAGSFGQDISSTIEWVDYIDAEGELRRFHRIQGSFEYRSSPFTSSEILVEAALRLEIGSSSEIHSRISRARTERKKRGHYDYPSAGSVFKNPLGLEISAGQLADQVGLKGFSVGDAMVSKKHANIVVNTANASSSDIRKVIAEMHERILKETGIDLQREIIYLG